MSRISKRLQIKFVEEEPVNNLLITVDSSREMILNIFLKEW